MQILRANYVKAFYWSFCELEESLKGALFYELHQQISHWSFYSLNIFKENGTLSSAISTSILSFCTICANSKGTQSGITCCCEAVQANMNPVSNSESLHPFLKNMGTPSWDLGVGGAKVPWSEVC
ncbi:hypothetical protein NL676_012479 [Syzygium grande]|nr:hypothetical protein NL676_012479 [Syzygium grande]